MFESACRSSRNRRCRELRKLILDLSPHLEELNQDGTQLPVHIPVEIVKENGHPKSLSNRHDFDDKDERERKSDQHHEDREDCYQQSHKIRGSLAS